MSVPCIKFVARLDTTARRDALAADARAFIDSAVALDAAFGDGTVSKHGPDSAPEISAILRCADEAARTTARGWFPSRLAAPDMDPGVATAAILEHDCPPASGPCAWTQTWAR